MKNPLYRKPDKIIGQAGVPYMLRWYVIPRNKYFNIYLHKFVHDDEDRAPHDHPWPSLSIILKGKYIEHTPIIYANDAPGKYRPATRVKIFKRWARIYRPPEYTHRIELFKKKYYFTKNSPDGKYFVGDIIKVPQPVWTLFITGRKVRDWGFHCPQGWRRWQDFVDPNNHGAVGPGCD